MKPGKDAEKVLDKWMKKFAESKMELKPRKAAA